MPEAVLAQALQDLGLQADVDRLSEFCQWLMVEGEKYGVTALDDPETVARELIHDSLKSWSCWTPGQRVVDLGSGGGVPGIPLALVLPETHFVLLEASQKKCRFLNETVEEFGLTNVSVENQRAELLGRDPAYRELCDGVVAKAVASVRVLLELAVPLLKPGGVLVAHKGPRLDQEMEEAKNALGQLKTTLTRVEDYALGPKSYRLAYFEKKAPTPSSFPRRNGIPAKKPL